MKWLLIALTFALGQTTTVGTGAGHGLSGIKVSWYSGPNKKIVMLHLENVSGKDINAYALSTRFKYADESDYTPAGNSESIMMFAVSLPNGMEPQSFVSGTSRDEVISQGSREISDVIAIPDVIVYTDDTAEVQNKRAFNQIVDRRKGELAAMQKADEVIKRMMDNAAVSDLRLAAAPRLEAADELKRIAEDSRKGPQPRPEQHGGMASVGIWSEQESQLETIANELESAHPANEKEFIENYVADLEKRIELMKPHCELAVEK